MVNTFVAALAFASKMTSAAKPALEHYLAIGSMMNPVSVRNRNLQLEASQRGQAAELLDHQLNFYGPNGFAEVRAWVDSFWDQTLDAFVEYAEGNQPS